MKRLCLGYVGAGFMAQKVHLPNFRSIPECELVGLAELRPELGRKVQQRLEIPRLYRSHQEMADDREIDAVAVSAGVAVQGQIACDLLRAGKHVFMEKPMAVSLVQGQEIVDAANASGCTFMIGYMKRYDAGSELAKEAIDQARHSGQLGEPSFMRAHDFCGDWICELDTPFDSTDEPVPAGPPPRLPDWLPADHVRRYLDYSQEYCHSINLLRWLLDAGDDVCVEAVSLDEDGFTGVVVLQVGGIRTTLETGLLSYYRYDEHYQLYFSDGWVKMWGAPLLHRDHPAEVEIYHGGDTQRFVRPLPKDRWSWSYKREAEAFVHAVLHGAPVRTPARDTLTDVRVFEDIYRMWLRQKGVL
jgi:predicted dehydrogenase